MQDILESTGLKDLELTGKEKGKEKALKLYGRLLMTEKPKDPKKLSPRVEIPRGLYLTKDQKLNVSLKLEGKYR